MSVGRSPLRVSESSLTDARLLVVEGVLDATTYLLLRNMIIKAALEGPRAVIVDVTALSVPAPSAWSVFTSARWHVSVWPDVQIVLACDTPTGRDAARRAGITRYVPVFSKPDEAVADLPSALAGSVRRAHAELPTSDSISAAGELIRQWLTGWECTEFIAAATLAATVLVENAASHAGGAAVLRVESRDRTVTVAVEDVSVTPPARREHDVGRCGLHGLDYLDVICRTWGHHPTTAGKWVWAVIGREDCL